MSALEKRALQRVRYAQGQMLRSVDFRDQLADVAQHRWWHNRALHDAYGVYQGLTPAGVLSGGALVGVTIAAGVGVDCFGRELIVDSPQTVALPTNAPRRPVRMVLLIRYGNGGGSASQAMAEICWAVTAPQGASTVSFVWMPLDRVRLWHGVPLAEVIYGETGPSKLTADFVPPAARPIARPAIAAGETLPAKTAWQTWSVDAPLQIGHTVLSHTPFGVRTRVDTSAAGFMRTPRYFAWLGGPLFNRNTATLLPDMFSSLADESATGFTFQMWFPPEQLIELAFVANPTGTQIIRTPEAFFPFARQQKLYVRWLACEMPPAVPYVPMSLRILNELLLPIVLQKVE
jgi:hypothetical protein